MPLTVLFDLDDTLLQTNGVAFLPYYYKALGESFSFLAPEEKIIQQVRFAVQKMIENQDPGMILKDVFAEHFYKPLGTTETACKTLVENFYNTEYPKLEKRVSRKPAAKPLIDWCRSQGIQAAITTDPLFPSMATRHRIKWAGLDAQDFEFFTTFDDFHFTKPHLAYYAEVLGRLGWPDSPVFMIGDNFNHDIKPIKSFGYAGFWVNPDSQDMEMPHGTLRDAQTFLKGFLDFRRPVKLNSDPSILIAILQSTPAVLDTWIRQMLKNKTDKVASFSEKNLRDIISHLNQRELQLFIPALQSLNENPNGNRTNSNTTVEQEFNNSPVDIDTSKIFQKFLENRKRSLSLLIDMLGKGQFNNALEFYGGDGKTVHDLVTKFARQDRAALHQYFEFTNI